MGPLNAKLESLHKELRLEEGPPELCQNRFQIARTNY